MENFKGTKGKWEVRGNKIFIEDTYKSVATIHVVKNYKDITFEPIEDVEQIANAQLISKSPEMLEMLQSLENDDNSIPKAIWDNIQKLIKEVTKLK